MSTAILSVSQLTLFIKSLLEGDSRLSDVFVRGEISNFKSNGRSGHLYFSLKDENSLIHAVMFSSSARKLKFIPEDGLRVIARGRVTVYEPSGQYQLRVEDIEPEGLGALSIAFSQLKDKLEREGLFLAEHKKPIPKYPSAIGVITSPTGAAIRDILDVTSRRWPAAKIIFRPVPVQGEEAPPMLRRAVETLSAGNICDVIILGRGGGSQEDLSAFNDEALARAIYASNVPVISAVGHETDFTICDFVSDLRAPTPSAAAELATPDSFAERERISSLAGRMRASAEDRIESLRQKLDLLTLDSPLSEPEAYLDIYRERLGEVFGTLLDSYMTRTEAEKNRLALLAGHLDAISPLKVLSRGFAVVTKEGGETVTDIARIDRGEKLWIKLHRGKFSALVTDKEEY